jgi:hypothetical protein
MDVSLALQDQFLKLFFISPLAEHFYLTGGTALARFYFHHRESLDLDLFTNDQDQDFSQVNQVILSILHNLDLQIASQVITETYIQYIVTNPADISLKVDLVRDIPVHFGNPLIRSGVRVDSIENIGSNKILAVFGRTDAKDFIDLYWILQIGGLRFPDLYQQACQKDLGLSELYLAYALNNIGKINLFPRMLQPLPWEDIKYFYQKLANDLIIRIKPD